MKTLLFAAVAAMVCALPIQAASCKGEDGCKVCSNCEKCAHCKAGGTCGKCKK